MLLKNYFLAENIVFITIVPRNKFYLQLYGRITALYVKIGLVMYTILFLKVSCSFRILGF